MEKENKVKKFFKENREVIALAVAGAVCAGIGAVAMYKVNEDSIKLGNALEGFKHDKNGRNDLAKHLTKYMGSSKEVIYDGGINNPYCTDCEQKLIEQGRLEPGRLEPGDTVAGLYALIIKK